MGFSCFFVTFVESVAFFVDPNFAGFFRNVDASSRFFSALFFVHRSASHADLKNLLNFDWLKINFYLDFLHSLLFLIFGHLFLRSWRETVLFR
jgi:hypothetical protein